MRAAVLLVAGAVAMAPRPARAEPQSKIPTSTYDYLDYVRLFVGVGSVPQPELFESCNANTALTFEIAHRPFHGALSTGFSFSSVTDVNGLWNVLTPGAFAKLDLTYVFTSGLWSHRPTLHPFVRILVGARVGFGVSQSFVHIQSTADSRYEATSSYVLVRPEMEPIVDLEFPFGHRHDFAFVARGAVDTPVTFDTIFRWSVSLGIGYAWGKYEGI